MAVAGCASAADGGSSTRGTGPSADSQAPSNAASDGPGAGAASGTSTGGDSASGTTVTLITHDSFAVDPDTLAAFERSSGITVKLLAQGDTGEVVSKLILTKDNPLGDAVFGIDNTFASKAIDAGVLAPYQSPRADNGASRFAIGEDHLLTAVDYGDVCVNVDHEYFADHDVPEPTTFEDLTKPKYADLFVTEDPATSSPGLAFLLGTIAHFGADGWQDYWKALRDNGVKIESGWTTAYNVDFSGAQGKGDRPLVVSYASSPPSEVPDGAEKAPTGALLDTCFRQVEYAGVLAGAKHPEAAGKVIDFLLSTDFQQQVPGEMYVYPVDRSVSLPADWSTFAPTADDPATIAPAEIGRHRSEWISDWSDIMHG